MAIMETAISSCLSHPNVVQVRGPRLLLCSEVPAGVQVACAVACVNLCPLVFAVAQYLFRLELFM